MKAYGLSANSFTVGDLEDWTKGELAFNGTSTYCSLANSSIICNNVNISVNDYIIEVYFKTNNAHVNGVILAKYGASGTGYQLSIDNAGKVQASFMNNGSASFSRFSSLSVNDAKWYHVLIEVNRVGSINIFINGVLSNGSTSGSMPSAATSITNTNDLLVGKNVSGNFFAGTILNCSFQVSSSSFLFENLGETKTLTVTASQGDVTVNKVLAGFFYTKSHIQIGII